MKNWFPWLLFLVAVAVAPAGELLTNPGFEGEYSGTAKGWWVNAWGGDTPKFRLSRETADVQAGAAAQRLQVTDLPAKAGAILRQDVTFQQGHVYRARLWLRSPDGIQVQILLRRSGPHYDAGAIRGLRVGPAWQRVEIEGGFGDGDVAGFLGVSAKSPGTLLVDEAGLADVTSEVLARPTPREPVPATFFGIHLNKLGSHNVWPDLGAGSLRLWDTATCWCNLQPEPERWDWTRLDYYVRHVEQHAPGASLLLTLGITPKWAGPPGGKESYRGTSAPPLDPEHWRAYVRTVAQRHRGRIRHWEIWNESDYGGFYTGTPAQMMELARIAWEELKAVDPANVVLTPNITRGGLAWFDEYLSLGGGRFADVISFHCYPPPVPEHAVANFAGVQDLVRSHGLGDKPVWNTEGAVESKTPLSEDEAMGAVARSYLVAWAQAIQSFHWYCWDIHWPGGANLSRALTGPDLAPGGLAYRRVATWLTGSVMTRRIVEGGVWTVELKRTDGRVALVAWSAQGVGQLAVPAGWNRAKREDLRGQVTEIGNGPVPLGPAPVLVEPGG